MQDFSDGLSAHSEQTDSVQIPRRTTTTKTCRTAAAQAGQMASMAQLDAH